MVTLRTCVLLAQFLTPALCFLHWYPIIDGDIRSGDAGEPLLLTPYIESGNITQAQNLARVPLTDSLNITSYSGFFTVNKTYNSNQFFWYFPAMTRDPDAPVLLWLQGGPGASSLFGLFTENGPIQIVNDELVPRKYNWALNHHMIYIDNPVQSGFSFTEDPRGLCSNEDCVGEDLYHSLLQFFQLFPEIADNKFYISGESYAGKYVPALGHTIHKKNQDATMKINLKGLAIGNGFSDPEHQLSYGKFLYEIGLIDSNHMTIVDDHEIVTVLCIKQKSWEMAFYSFSSLLNEIHDMIGFQSLYNYLHTSHDLESFGTLLQEEGTRRAIHVGNLPFNRPSVVYHHLITDFMQSVAPLVSELLNHYDVLVYNGQLDIIVAYPLTVNYLKNLNFSGAEKYKNALRHQWEVDGEIAGYVKRADNLTEVMVRNAGHMVPSDQPKWALDLITRFTSGKSFETKVHKYQRKVKNFVTHY